MPRLSPGRRPTSVLGLLRLEDRLTPSFANPVGLTPDQVRKAYGIDSISFHGITGDGTGQTIAIVAAHDNPNIAADLATFKRTFGNDENQLNARPVDDFFTKVNQRGGTQMPAADPVWAAEIALDVQWAHAVAPMADIVLVLADTANDADMLAAVRYAATIPGVSVVSSSFGRGETAADAAGDTFVRPGVSFVVSAGDVGRPAFPASLADVLTVGGTALTVSADGTWVAEGGWTYTTFTDVFGNVHEAGGGGGVSQFQPRPGFQDGVATIVGDRRGTPDVAYNADPTTGVAVLDTYNNPSRPWSQVGGTSAGTPQWAALLAIVNQGRELTGLAPLNSDADSNTLQAIYDLSDGYFHDITTGRNAAGQHAGVGYDLLTGRGTPRANILVPKLAGVLAETSIEVSTAPSAITLGEEATLVATVVGNGLDGTPTGSVRFTAGGVVLGTAELIDGVATLVTTQIPTVGAVTITAGYLGDENYEIADGTGDITVNPPTATVTVSLPIDGSTYGKTVMLSATVEGAVGTPTGTVTFRAGTLDLGTAELIDGIATIDTSLLPAGEAVRVTATYSGDADYTTSLGDGDLYVAKATLLLKAADVTRVYGTANPAFTVTTDDTLFNGDTLGTILTGKAATNATVKSGVGLYQITKGTLAAVNYDLIFDDGVLAVTPAKLLLAAFDATKTYGDANPNFALTAAGLTAGDTLATAVAGSVSTAATATSGVGFYAITQGSLTAANYDITFTPGALSVTPAKLFVSAANQTRTYGAANPAFTVTTAGLVNGDAATDVLSGTVTTGATAASGVGTYAITRGTLTTGPNYTLVYTNGTLSVTPAPLTLTATDAAKVYGSANPAFAVTGSGFVNGDTLASAVTGSATAASGGVGTHAITAGNLKASNYTITFVPGTLTVTPAPLTLAASNQVRRYGESLANLTVTATGLVNGDALATAVAGAAGTTATARSGVGIYAITRGNLNASNYDVTFLPGTLTVAPARLTVTADDAARTYGAANPPLTFKVAGLTNGDTVAGVVTGSLATEASARSGVGGYAITAGTLVVKNYEYTFVPGTLSVAPAPLLVKADDAAKVYGSAVPPLTYSVAGLVNGDAPAFTGALETTATAGSGVGSYPIARGTLASADPNYAVTFAPGTLAVTPAPLTVTPNDAARTAFQANPSFTARIGGLVNGDTAAVLDGTLTLATAADRTSPPGDYAITAAGLSSPNYAVTFAPGKLSVEPIRYDATTIGSGTSSLLVVMKPNGVVAAAFPAFEPGFTGPTTVATADVNRDGYEDIVVGAGAGGGPRVRVYSGSDFRLIADFFAYEESFRGGVNVAAGDVDGDGYADIVCGAGDQGAPAVRVFSGRDRSLLSSFFAYEDSFRSGVTVAAADLDGDGRAEVVAGSGAGGGPVVKVFDGRTGTMRASYFAFDPEARGGISVAAGPGWIAAGAGSGMDPTVNVRATPDLSRTAVEFQAFSPAYRGGVLVSAATGGRLTAAPADRTGPPAGLWDPLTGTFLGGVPVT